MTERLTTLTAVKDWLNIQTDSSDSFLNRLIVSASQYALDYMNRDTFALTEYTQEGKGNGKDTMLLRNWPVVSVSSVGIQGTVIPAATIGNAGLPSNGYTISQPYNAPQSLNLYGRSFYYGAFVQVVYQSGYAASQEIDIPASNTDPVGDYCTVVTSEAGQWISDNGVLIDGVAATLVTANPTGGQYAVDEFGTYTFNAAADEGKTATISFDYCPYSVSEAVTELIAEWYRRKDRIGLLSKTLGGQETVTFSQKDMNDTIRNAFNFYSNVVPI